MNTPTQITERARAQGKRLKALRLHKGWKQRELAARLDVDPITVSRWERGAFVPSDLHRVKLYQLLGIEPSSWYVLDDEAAA